MIANKDVLMAAKGKFPSEIVHVPELGCDIRVQGLSTKDMLDYVNADYKGTDATIQLILRSIVDAEGRRIFGDEGIEVIASWPTSVFQKLSNAASRVNGGDAAGNLNETDGGGFSTVSLAS